MNAKNKEIHYIAVLLEQKTNLNKPKDYEVKDNSIEKIVDAVTEEGEDNEAAENTARQVEE